MDDAKHIDRLVVENFKSYGGQHVIGPFHTFSAIIGPNGSGKSNVMDAISFVLGIRTAVLRSAQLSELLHKKKVGDKDEHASSGYVELVYTNKDQQLTFKRTLKLGSDNKATSHYMINGKIVKWDAYDRQLKDIGILVKARNFLVFQGDVQSIAAKDPKQLTTFFESVSGSGDLKAKYEELEEAKEVAEKNYLHVFETKRTINKEKKALAQQKEEADLFHQKLEELHTAKQDYFLWQLRNAHRELQTAEQKEENIESEMERAQNEYKEMDEKAQAANSEYAKARKAMVTAAKAIEKAEAAFEKKKQEQLKSDEEVNHLRKTLRKAQKKMADLTESQKKKLKEIASLEADLADKKAERDSLEEKAEEGEENRVKLAKNQLEEYNKLKKQAGKQTTKLHQQMEGLKRALRNAKEEHDQTASVVQTLHQAKETAEKAQAKAQEKLSQLEKHHTEREATLADSKVKLIEAKDKIHSVVAKKEELTKRLHEITQKLQEANVDIAQSEKEKRLKDALTTLKARMPGKVTGRVLDICKPSAMKYNLGVTVVMGKNMEAVIVDTEKTAIECITYLKEKKIGTMTFLPIDQLKTTPISEELRLSLTGSMKLVIDVLHFQEQYERAVLFACGSALICDDLTEARKFAFPSDKSKRPRSKIVTLDGSIIHKGGNMTGGIGKYHKQAEKWGEADMRKWVQEKDSIVEQLNTLERDNISDINKIDTLQQSVSKCENNLKYTAIEMKKTREKVTDAAKEVKNIEKDIAKKQPHLNKLKIQVDAKEKEVEKLHEEVLSVENKVFAAFSVKIGVNNIREYEEVHLKKQEELLQRQAELDQYINRLESQIEYENKRDLKGEMDGLKAKIDKDEKQLSKLEANNTAIKEALEKQKEQMAADSAEREKEKQNVDKLQAEYTKLKREATKLQQGISKQESDLIELQTQTQRCTTQFNQVVQDCRLQRIDIPMRPDVSPSKKKKRKSVVKAKPTPSSSSKQKKGKKKRRLQEEEEEEEEKEEPEEKTEAREEEVEAIDGNAIDFSSVSAPEGKTGQDMMRIKNDYEKKIHDLNEDISKEAPNLKADEHLSEVKDRLEKQRQEWEERKKASKEAQNEFEKVKQERTKLFLDCFEHVSKNINKIYSDLTQSAEFELGGTASMYLVNTEEPFLDGIRFSAQPPAKGFVEISELSGGEKTVAALALLFAVHSFRPAPFFVLDEVDAALDKRNVSQVSNYIRLRAVRDKLQCIVISLKDDFFTKADALVGIYRDLEEQHSGTLTLNLNEYNAFSSGAAGEEEEEEEEEEAASTPASKRKKQASPATTSSKKKRRKA